MIKNIYLLSTALIIVLIIYYYYNKGIKDLIEMYNNQNNYIYVYANGGLGNMLMSVSGVLILSIIYESKPICIL